MSQISEFFSIGDIDEFVINIFKLIVILGFCGCTVPVFHSKKYKKREKELGNRLLCKSCKYCVMNTDKYKNFCIPAPQYCRSLRVKLEGDMSSRCKHRNQEAALRETSVYYPDGRLISKE